MIIHMNTSIVRLNIENQFVHPDPPVGGSELIFTASVNCRTGVNRENQFTI